jgi:hypothetical protein
LQFFFLKPHMEVRKNLWFVLSFCFVQFWQSVWVHLCWLLTPFEHPCDSISCIWKP